MSTEQEHLSMHREHRLAQSEHASWLDDIGRWRAQHKKALAALVTPLTNNFPPRRIVAIVSWFS
ncbi:hypothetical protein Pan161_52930 [Gimesia algae]|uniref:Uncharacterized protein n=1 Tax=Gimesia algae TaxID=2527971 RepID=A0A517VKR5_9PLAN|nr:hypothetical protein Pan161_52930 [Gimesia algae]